MCCVVQETLLSQFLSPARSIRYELIELLGKPKKKTGIFYVWLTGLHSLKGSRNVCILSYITGSNFCQENEAQTSLVYLHFGRLCCQCFWK